jgi:cysteine-rich repeat protein
MRTLLPLTFVLALVGCTGGDAADPACEGDDCGAPASVCGDGVVGSDEGCDDGNAAPGDGCSSACSVEADCGNGSVEKGERCDDGNEADGDGCSAVCRWEGCGDGVLADGEGCDDGNRTDGDGCDSICVATGCGNGHLTAGEACDDGNWTAGDGCSPTCAVEGCGDGVVSGAETCDDGNTADGDCCSAACTFEMTCEREPNDDARQPNPIDEIAVDGRLRGAIDPVGDKDSYLIQVPDGVASWKIDIAAFDAPGSEACLGDTDDAELELTNGAGELQAWDWSTSDDVLCSRITTAATPGKYTLIVRGYEFDGASTFDYALTVTMTPIVCGDGTVDLGEACDDGNTVGGDGCDANCTPTACGNGEATGAEVCDDGNDVSGDGCDTNCTLSACGNGVKGGAETCDDGNAVGGDGCDADCVLETPCGNLVVDPGETCDDGGFQSGDGCSFPACTLEPGHLFETEPNDDPSAATDLGTLAAAPSVLSAHGALDPSYDIDYYTFELDAVTDLRVRNRRGGAEGECMTLDTYVEIEGPDGNYVGDACDTLVWSGAPAGEYTMYVYAAVDDEVVPAYEIAIAAGDGPFDRLPGADDAATGCATGGAGGLGSLLMVALGLVVVARRRRAF